MSVQERLLRMRIRRPLSLRSRATILIAAGIVSVVGTAAYALALEPAVQAAYANAHAAEDTDGGASTMLVSILDQQAAMRGFVATGDPRFATQFAAARLQEQAGAKAVADGSHSALLRARSLRMFTAAGDWNAWSDQRMSDAVAHGPTGSLAPAAEAVQLIEAFRAEQAAFHLAISRDAAEWQATGSRTRTAVTDALIGGLGMSAAVLVFAAYLAMRLLVRPLTDLAGVARALAADEEVYVPYDGRHDEVGELASALRAWQYASSERIAMAKLAAESDERFRMVFDRAPIGICRVGMDTRILDSNPTLQRMLGYTAEEMLQRRVTDIIHPEDRDRNLGYYAARAELFSMEERYLRRDGDVFWGLLTSALVRHPDGRPLFFVSMVEDINDRKQRESYLIHQAAHDTLTGLANRARFFDVLDRALDDRRAGEQSLVVLDLDGFKAVNDSHGHAAGDELLRQVASRMQECVRNTDLVARLGGDEFAVFLPGTDAEGAAVAGRKLLTSLARRFAIHGHQVNVGASLGIAVAPGHGETSADLLHAADAAMYRAKREGGGVAVA